MSSYFSKHWKSLLQTRYTALEPTDGQRSSIEEEDIDEKEGLPQRRIKFWHRRRNVSHSYIIYITVLCLALGIVFGFLIWENPHHNNADGHDGGNDDSEHYTCPNSELAERHEWSTLSKVEKREYIQGVKCLMDSKSKMRPNGKLFEDFSYISAMIGMHTTGVASFFPWHRYLLHIFEKEMRETCGFRGNLTYWDWTRNSESLAKSPVFESYLGFGGSGNKKAPSIGGGYCVADGHFAGRHLAFEFIVGQGIQPKDHCLSRGFDENDPEGRVAGAKVEKSVIKEILAQPDYESFSNMLQAGPATTITEWIHGEFSQYTATNDPLFYLHLVQLDRVWWIWQHLDAFKRFDEYSGFRRHDFDFRANLNDTISLGGVLAPDVTVMDAMWGQWGDMCYKYV